MLWPAYRLGPTPEHLPDRPRRYCPLRVARDPLPVRRLGHRERPHEIAEVVGERIELKADSVGRERAA